MSTTTTPASSNGHRSEEPQNPLHHLTEEQIDELAKEFDTIHDEVFESLGERDSKYIHAMIELHRRLLVLSRVELFAARSKIMWLLGTTGLSLAKILENMEIGHNVMHGQWDWMNDPEIHSSTWDWDTASTAEAWRHSHNYIHHTYTNIRGKDKDLGYEIMRVDPHQKWHPVYLLQPFYNVLLMAFFEWGVALHDLDLDAVRAGEKSHKQVLKELKGISGKARDQVVKDYIAWPLVSAAVATGVELAWKSSLFDRVRPGHSKVQRAKLKATKVKGKLKRNRDDGTARLLLESGRKTYKSAVTANLTANFVRNVWSNAIIFCGHFPDQTYTFSQQETENESRGGWYVRQLVGAANIDGSPMFHVLSGNLGYQVEHHLFPDMPSTRYGEIAPRVRDICERYELPYNSGGFWQQWSSVQRTILRLAFPGGKQRPKPGPYHGPRYRGSGERVAEQAQAA